MIAAKKSENIKKNCSDREKRPTKRAKADTNTFLPPGKDRQKIEEPPEPENDLDKDDCKRLQKGLRYINGVSMNKMG